MAILRSSHICILVFTALLIGSVFAREDKNEIQDTAIRVKRSSSECFRQCVKSGGSRYNCYGKCIGSKCPPGVSQCFRNLGRKRRSLQGERIEKDQQFLRTQDRYKTLQACRKKCKALQPAGGDVSYCMDLCYIRY